MILYPAIDLINKECVRLKKGDYSQKTVFNKDPVKQAQTFEKEGCTWIHVVDLDAAKGDESRNVSVLLEIKQKTNLKIQFGGGIRTAERLKSLFDLGIDRAIIGTAAFQDLNFLATSAAKYPNKIWLGTDVLNGKIKIHGWTKDSDLNLDSALEFASKQNIGGIILTDINKDGMMQGPNIEMTIDVASTFGTDVILSGGVSNIKDIETIKELEDKGISGLICGRAIYDNKVNIAKALDILGNQDA